MAHLMVPEELVHGLAEKEIVSDCTINSTQVVLPYHLFYPYKKISPCHVTMNETNFLIKLFI